MQRAPERRLFPIHDRDDLEVVVKHDIPNSRIAPHETGRLVSGPATAKLFEGLREHRPRPLSGDPLNKASVFCPLLLQSVARTLRATEKVDRGQGHALDRRELPNSVFPK